MFNNTQQMWTYRQCETRGKKIRKIDFITNPASLPIIDKFSIHIFEIIIVTSLKSVLRRSKCQNGQIGPKRFSLTDFTFIYDNNANLHHALLNLTCKW